MNQEISSQKSKKEMLVSFIEELHYLLSMKY